MDFHINAQQREMIASVRELAQSEFKANAGCWMDGTFPWPNMKKLAELGVLGMSVPEEYGGLGLEFRLRNFAHGGNKLALLWGYVEVHSGSPAIGRHSLGGNRKPHQMRMPGGLTSHSTDATQVPDRSGA